MRSRGRLVIPAELRTRAGPTEGSPFVVLDTASGVVLLTRDQLKARVRADLDVLDLTGELFAERRVAATDENGW